MLHTRGIVSLLLTVVIVALLVNSCTVIRKAPKSAPYLTRNTIEVKGGNFTNIEKSALLSRLYGQLDDSSQVISREALFVVKTIIRPPVYDSGYSVISAANMKASMFHLGYYDALVSFTSDTSNRKVHVRYIIDAGKPTLIDTLSYGITKPELQQLAEKSKKQAILVKNNPITKAGVQGEISRLVDTFRNNGFYKFTAAELRVRGDTTIEALTTITDDPFEQLRLLSEAERQADSPHIRLAIVLNPPSDTTRLTRFYINDIIVLPDFSQGDLPGDSGMVNVVLPNASINYHQRLFKPSFLAKNVTLRKGDVFRQSEFYRTVNNFTKAGVWESVNIRMIEDPDSINQVDIIIELVPGRKYGFEAALEASYSATSNTTNALGGNLFGISGNLSLTDRNVGKEAIKMTHSLRAGIELNNNRRTTGSRLINSQEISYSNNIVFPRLITPFSNWNRKPYVLKESFINSNIAYSKRLDLFNTQSFNLNYGWSYIDKYNLRWSVKPINIEFNYLYNQTDSFTRILDSIPFLRYSYNTALIMGISAGVSSVYRNPRHLRSLSKERTINLNIEESGLTWGALPFFDKYKRKYIKADVEYKYTVTYKKTELAFRLFTGVGFSLGNDTTLPFFKQYFSGGSNGMRGWPIRGIGRGSQKLVPYGQNIFNDRTADMQLEGNAEYRYVIARIIPNTLTLRGALFVDAGNIWNMRNSRPDGSIDSAQFKFKNLYKELGLSAGTGFRLDFNYFVLRLDLGFRFKRPELSHINSGWKAPSIGFNDVLPKLFGRSNEYRQWRYENFNFTIGISYPF